MDKWRPTECVIPAPELLDSIASGLSAERVADLEIDCADIVEQSLLSVMRNPDADFYDGSQEWRPFSYILTVDDYLDAINSGRDVFQIPYDEDIAINVSTDAIVRAML